MATDRVTRIEHGRFWIFGRLLIPRSKRRSACERRGDHRPEIIDAGRAKLCPYCGTW